MPLRRRGFWKPVKTGSALILLLVVCGLARAQCPTGPGTCHVIGTQQVFDSSGGPFLTGHVYLMQGLASVPAGQTLTWQPGAIVKFWPQNSVTLIVFGTLNAAGTAAQPITVTSYRDDSVGGDNNADGNATVPAPGDWGEILVGGASGACTLDHCVLRYAGSNFQPGLSVQGAGGAISNCTFSNCVNAGVDLTGQGPTTVTNCAFTNNGASLIRMRLGDIPAFLGNTASGNALGDDVTIYEPLAYQITSSVGWSPANTMNGNGVLWMQTGISIGLGGTLTLAAGMKVKFQYPHSVDVYGALVCNGTPANPVAFTALTDDSIGGDTQKDGVTAGAPGTWVGISISSGGAPSTLTNVKVRYAGYQAPAAVSVSATGTTLTNVVIDGSAHAGLTLNGVTATVTGCSFNNNLSAIGQVPFNSLPGFTNNTASGNTNGNYLAIGAGTLNNTTLSLGPANSLNNGAFVLVGDITLGSTGILNLAAGTVFKMSGQRTISIDGALHCAGTGPSPVVFTSIDDDTWAGDTTNNGAATSPSPGQWAGIAFSTTAAASTLDHTLVRYAGAGAAAIALTQANVALTSSTIDSCLSTGLSLAYTTYPTVTGCAFNNCGGLAPVDGVGIDALPGFTLCTAAGNAGGNFIRIAASNVTANEVLSPANTLNASGVFVFASTVTVNTGATLTLPAGDILKWSGATSSLTVNGNLSCNGTPGNPVVFTSINDDSVGGDTTNNGATTGAPGDWRGISTGFGAGPFTLTNVLVKYAGGNGAGVGAISLVTQGAVLSGVTVQSCFGAGLDLNGNARPMVSGCAFNNNARAVDGVPIDAVPSFTNNTASGNAAGNFLRVTTGGAGSAPALSIGPANTLNGSSAIVCATDLVVPGTQTFTVAAGTVFKFAGANSMSINGVLLCNGTQASPVVFTSLPDDGYGGDTTNNGGATAPAPGDWVGMTFGNTSDASVLTSTRIRYAGHGCVPAVTLYAADVTFDHVTFEFSQCVAVDLTGTSSPTFTNCTFLNNGGLALAGLTWGALGKMSGTTANGNVGGNATHIDSPVVSGHVVVQKHSYFGTCIICSVSPQLSPSDTLVLERGVIVKFTGPTVVFPLNAGSAIHGTGLEPVVLTTIKDDTIAGDSNGDGNATLPLPGDWGGVPCTGGTIEHALVRYAGGGGQTGGISGFLTVSSSRVERSATRGFDIAGPWVPSVNLVAWSNASDGIRLVGNGATAAVHCTAADNGGYGIGLFTYLGSPFSWDVTGCIAWHNGLNPGPYAGSNYATNWSLFLNWCIGIGTYPCTPGFPCNGASLNCALIDPLFVNEAAGDLRLQPGSPGLNLPITVYVGYPTNVTRDIMDAPRALDDDRDGPHPMLPDVGAYERTDYSLVVTGDPQLGAMMSFTVVGPPGYCAFVSGPGFPDTLIAPYGYLLAGDLASIQLVAVGSVGVPLVAAVPQVPQLVGQEVAVQALAVPLNNQSFGNFTSVYRALVFQ